jgi:pimeloyl-ACP methyl ester carboxylesterase
VRVAVAITLAVTACSSENDGPAALPSTTSTTTVTAATEEEIKGMFDVGSHELHLSCVGNGSPTIIYMHGAIYDASVNPSGNGTNMQHSLDEDHRFCVYDRRNLGRSDTVNAVQTPENAIADMHALMNAAEVEPPYVLLGASFGGLLAHLYANTYPDEVVGMVMLDSPFPDEMPLEALLPPDETYEAFDAEDENESLERISHYDAHVAAQAFIGKEPAIPLIYFASLEEPIDEWSDIPEWSEQILEVRQAFVDRWSPGELREVDAPHFMEPSISSEIIDALREVIALARA